VRRIFGVVGGDSLDGITKSLRSRGGIDWNQCVMKRRRHSSQRMLPRKTVGQPLEGYDR
jgi:hypothetical protein